MDPHYHVRFQSGPGVLPDGDTPYPDRRTAYTVWREAVDDLFDLFDLPAPDWIQLRRGGAVTHTIAATASDPPWGWDAGGQIVPTAPTPAVGMLNYAAGWAAVEVGTGLMRWVYIEPCAEPDCTETP